MSTQLVVVDLVRTITSSWPVKYQSHPTRQMLAPNVPFVGILPHLCIQKSDAFIRVLQTIPMPDSSTITSTEIIARIASLDQD